MQYTIPKEFDFSPQAAETLEAEIQKFLQKGIVETAEHEQGEFISNIFLRPKEETRNL